MIAFLILSCISTRIYYERRQGIDTANSKLTSLFDIWMYFIKVALLIFVNSNLSLKYDESNIFIPSFLVFVSIFLLYKFIFLRPYQSLIITKAYISLLIIFTWTNCVLLFGVLTFTSHCNCSLQLFLVGFLLILIIIYVINPSTIFNTRNRSNPLLWHNKFSNERAALRYLVEFSYVIAQRRIIGNRLHYEYLIEYASLQEQNEHCVGIQSPMKKYLQLSANEITNKNTEVDLNIKEFYLIQHLDNLYHEALNKYPLSVSIRISYALFLMDYNSKNKKQSIQVLNKLEQYRLNMEEKFIVFRLKKIIDEYSQMSNLNSSSNTQIGNNMSTFSVESSDQLSFQFNYKQYLYYINKVSRIYLSFWTLILNRSQNIHDDIVKLSNYGYEINDKIEDVKRYFNKLQEIKLNDTKVLVLYAKFLKDILNDDKECLYISNLIKNVEDMQGTYEESDMNLIDLSYLSKSTDFQYVIASGLKDSIGLIINISLGICSLFGYTYEEIIGNNIDLFIPEFLQAKHKKMIQTKLDANIQIDPSPITNSKSSPSNNNILFKELLTFGKTKSKYLTLIKLKTAILSNEKNEINLFAKITPQTYLNSGTCTVLTNSNLMIQSFTPSALNLLEMNSKCFNSSLDITPLIKEFYEEFLSIYTDNQSKIDKQKLKTKILKKRYVDTTALITWRKAKKTQERNIIDHSDNKNANNSSNSIIEIAEEMYLLFVTEITINDEVIGYAFRFDYNEICNKKNSKMSSSKVMKNISFTPTPSNQKKRQLSSNIVSINIPIGFRKSNCFVPNNDEASLNINALSINDQFLPEQSQLTFDPSNMSYYVNKKAKQTMEEYFKREVKYKMKNIEDISSFGEYEEEDESESSKLSEVISSSNNDDLLSIKELQKEKEKDKDKEKSQSLVNNDQYYKVNMAKIKLLIYDFRKKMVIEQQLYKQISQVEVKKNDRQTEEVTSSIESEYQSNTNNRQKKSTDNKDSMLKLKTNKNGSNITSDLETEIADALNKLNQPISFFKLRFISLVVILILITVVIIYIIIFYQYLDINKALNSGITNGYCLLTQILSNQYLLLEYILIHQTAYVNYFQSREEYSKDIQNKLLLEYNKSSIIINDVLSSNLPLSHGRENQITSNFIIINITNSKFQFQPFNMTIIPILYEAMTAMYSFATLNDSDLINFSDDNFLYYILNIDNGTYFGLDWLLKLIRAEEKDRNTHAYYIALPLLIIMLLVIVIAFERLMMVYSVIEKRKEWYLKIFFDIDHHSIKKLISICENFISKTQNKDNMELLNDNFDNDLSNEDSILLHSNSNFKSNHLSNVKPSQKNDDSEKAQWLNKGEKIGIYITLTTYFGLEFILLVFLSILYYQFTKIFENLGVIYKYSAEFEIYFIQMYNSMRNYAMMVNLDATLQYYYQSKSQFLLENAYKAKPIFWSKLADFNSQGFYPNELSELYHKLFHSDLCPFLDELETDNLASIKLTCETFLNNIASYGLDITISFYIQGLRKILYDLKDLIAETTESNKYDPFELFNSDNARDMCIMLHNVLEPIFDEWKSGLERSIEVEYTNFEFIAMTFFTLILGVNVALYFFYVIPKQTFLMTGLQKTKNMLSIMPKEVLYQILVSNS